MLWARKCSNRFLKLLLLIALACPACASEATDKRVSELGDAFRTSNIARAKQVIASGPIPDRYVDGQCWHHIAVLKQMPQLFAPLSEAGVPIDCQDNGGTTLQYAIASEHYGVVPELVRLGANVNASSNNEDDSYNDPPLNDLLIIYILRKSVDDRLDKTEPSTVVKEQKQLIKLLLEHGADPNGRRSPDALPALMLAAEEGATDVVTWLIGAGAAVNYQHKTKNGGITALEVAIFNNKSNIETVKTLLYAGADPTVGAYADQLLDKAKQNMPEAVQILKQYGAR